MNLKMDAEWSVAAGDDDPVVVTPWCEEAGALEYIDVRQDPALVERIAEARAWPEMRSALLRLNEDGSQVWTAKCDAWILSEEEKQLDFGVVSSGFGAYFDAIARDLSVFVSLDAQMSAARKLTAIAMELAPKDARAEFVLRPARWHEQEGYALTVYVYGYGEGEEAARSQWSEALRNIADAVAG
jgi:hypothetical protein